MKERRLPLASRQRQEYRFLKKSIKQLMGQKRRDPKKNGMLRLTLVNTIEMGVYEQSILSSVFCVEKGILPNSISKRDGDRLTSVFASMLHYCEICQTTPKKQHIEDVKRSDEAFRPLKRRKR